MVIYIPKASVSLEVATHKNEAHHIDILPFPLCIFAPGPRPCSYYTRAGAQRTRRCRECLRIRVYRGNESVYATSDSNTREPMLMINRKHIILRPGHEMRYRYRQFSGHRILLSSSHGHTLDHSL